MDIKNRELFDDLIAEAMQQEFSGWDFSYIRDRWKDSPTSWDYVQTVRSYIKPEISLLDIDTGGGEFLSSLQPLPQVTYATEAYAPNVLVAKNRLAILGVQIIDMVEKRHLLPFPDGAFDLVVNRHGSYSPNEIYRILKPKGVFVTQQVGGENNFEINKLLQEHPEFQYSYWTLSLARDQLITAGLQILNQQEEFPETRIFDIGALVYYLKVISWQIVGFTVERYYEKLAEVHNLIHEFGELKTRSHRFLIVAQKP